MNREILFKAKTTATKEWTYGHFAKQYDVPQIYSGNGHECIYEDTLCQYTGLIDKDGNKIFEGDILQGNEYPYCSGGNYNYYAEVVWFNNGCCGFGLCTHKNPKSSVRGVSDGNCEWFEEFSSSNWLVIGNIYDNPELIQEVKSENE